MNTSQKAISYSESALLGKDPKSISQNNEVVAVSFKPLVDVKKELKVTWYRCPIEGQKLRDLSARSDTQGWIMAGGHFALFLLTGGLAFFFWTQQIWWALIIALWCQGIVGSFYSGTATHELGHGSVFKSKRLNKLFLNIFSFIGWWDPFDYASSHTYHHRYTLHPDGDREVLLPLSPLVGRTFLIQLLSINLLTQPGRTFGKGGLISTLIVTIRSAFGKIGSTEIPSNEWLEALHEDNPEQHKKSIRWSRILLAGHGLVLVSGIITGYWILPFLISLPSFIANIGSYLVGMTQHCGLRDNSPDFRKNTRSVKLNPLYSFLYWHMNWHTEHHMYVGVPCYNLGELARAIADDMPEPRTLRQAWKEMAETWHKQQTNPDYQFDTPFPKTASPEFKPGDKLRHKKITPDNLANSLKDLSPEGAH